MKIIDSRRLKTLVHVVRASSIPWLIGAASKEIVRRLAGWPRGLLVESSTQCNLTCPWCEGIFHLSERKRKFLPASDLESTLRHASSHVGAVTFVRTGEPLENPEILEIIAIARRHRLVVTLNSNLATLDLETAKSMVSIAPHRIVTTLISAEKNEYEAKQVGGKFERTIDNIASLCELKRERGQHFPVIEVQLIATKTSVEQIDKFADIVSRLGCDMAFVKPMRVDLFRDGDEYRRVHIDDVPLDHEVCNYTLDEEGRLVLKHLGPCPQQENIYVSADGDVYPCLFGPEGMKPYGNLISEGWQEVWKESGLAKDKREKYLHRGDRICTNCVPSKEIALPVD
ncbi:MAG: radical SAM protein [Candidatus Coatesbacteria bacterium]|nr:radical SAM protein [Candidatus Coatesbacteria bacterium]